MNRLLSFFALFLLTSALAWGSELLQFRTQAQPDGVRLEWTAAPGPGVISYGVDRQDGPQDDFDQITSLTASTQPRYYYFDPNAGSATGVQPVTYRLNVHTAAGTRSYLSTPTTNDPLGRSWNLIKQMFR